MEITNFYERERAVTRLLIPLVCNQTIPHLYVNRLPADELTGSKRIKRHKNYRINLINVLCVGLSFTINL